MSAEYACSGEKKASIYTMGFLDGQAVAYCEAIRTGSKMAAQLVCSVDHRDRIMRLVESEGCKVLKIDGDGRVSIWIYRSDLAKEIISRLNEKEDSSTFGIWAMGKLLGYSDTDVADYLRTG